VIIFLTSEGFHGYTVVAFILGALTSCLSGYIGMYIATRANVRVTYCAAKNIGNPAKAFQSAFNVAFRGGCVMGFFLVSLALAILTFIIIIYKAMYNGDSLSLFEHIAGYGLGGSTVALFCRVGGGIYTKAADVGADLVGKNDYGFKEDDPKNPAVIADNVGDNVGDIAGMGSDLFGSFAESTCASLVIAAKFINLQTNANFMFPLLISAAGILACIVTSYFATNVMKVTEKSQIEKTLKWQLIISTLILIPVLVLMSLFLCPDEIYGEKVTYESANVKVMVCVLSGLIAGLIIGYFTDYFTSNAHAPTQHLAESCKAGAAINIIHGLALGYLSCIIPIIAIAITIYISFKLIGMYGISLAALGMLSNLAIGLAIDAYGPISDNAGGISEMSGLEPEVREITDALDAAGNTTAAIGKGFAIGSACLVSLALFGAFVSFTEVFSFNIR
jgi:H(+)-translocating pyrophosphatase